MSKFLISCVVDGFHFIDDVHSALSQIVDVVGLAGVSSVDASRYLVVIEYQHPFPIEFVSYMDSKFVFKKSKIKITATLEGV